MRRVQSITLVLALILGAAVFLHLAEGSDDTDKLDTVTLIIAVTALIVAAVSAVTSPNWHALEEDVRAIREAVESAPAPDEPPPGAPPVAKRVCAVVVVLGLLLMRGRR